MATKFPTLFSRHAVTQSSPSPGITYIHTVGDAAQLSRITDVNEVHGLAKSSCRESTTSRVLKDIHIVRTKIKCVYK